MSYIDDVAFNKATTIVLFAEGPMSNNRYDPGGLTKFGICQRSHPGVDIANLTREGALAIYWNEYWLRCGCDKMPWHYAMLTFDTAVNQGTDAAITCMQTALMVPPDGVMGPQTLGRIAAVGGSWDVAYTFMAMRTQRYVSIRDHDAQSYATNSKGWFRRMFRMMNAAGGVA